MRRLTANTPNVLLAGAMLVLVAGTAGCASLPGEAGASLGATGAADDRLPAPALTGELLDGSAFALADLADQVVVVNFWGSWCAPCRKEAPELVEAATDLAPLGVAFVGVNVRDQRPLAEAFVRSKALPFPSIFDPDGLVAAQFRETPPNAVPATLVLDRDHRVAAVFPGPVTATTLVPVVGAVAAEEV